VNGRHFETFDNFEEIIPRGLYGHKETQVGVPFNISWGGGTQGLHENLVFSAIPQTFCGEYIQDPELFPDNILSGTSLSGLTTNILLEKYFAGTFDGAISTFHMYAKPLSVPEIQHNARILYDQYDLLNPYCLNCSIIDNCDLDWNFVEVSNTPTPTVTPTLTPTLTPSPSGLPSLCLVVQAGETPTQYLQVLGLINSKPYFEYTQPILGRVFKIYWDNTQWVTLDIYENFICSTMNYSGLYPDTNFAPWILFTPPQPPYSTCGFVGTSTYPAPCLTPPNTPTPSTTVDCCETYDFVVSPCNFEPCVEGIEIQYLNCDNVWQTIRLFSGTTTLCLRYGPYNYTILDSPADCCLQAFRLGNCDCGVPPISPSQTPTQTPTVTNTVTPTITPTQTPTTTPTFTPTQFASSTPTPSVTPTITPSPGECAESIFMFIPNLPC
jgi:hypothetical protein